MSRAPFRSVVLLVVLSLGLTGWLPEVAAQAEAYGATAGDPVVLQDAASCLEQVAERSGIQCSVLYGHIFDLLNRVPINVQRPPPEAPDLADGRDPPVGYEPLFNYNEMTLYSTPGFVEYGDDLQRPRIHADSGIARDVHIPADVPLVGHWFLSIDASDGPVGDPTGGNGADAGAMPCITVRMTLQAGRYAGDGTVLAAGQTTKHVVNAQDGPAPEMPVPAVPCPGAAPDHRMRVEEVSEFVVELAPLADPLVIEADEGFIVHVEWSQFDPTGDSQHRVYSHQTNLRTGGEHRSRLVVPLQDAMAIEQVDVLPHGGKVYVRAHALAPWGVYDLDRDSLEMTLIDADGAARDLPTLRPPRITADMYHGGLLRPTVAQWEWDPLSEQIDPGVYTLRIDAQNWQHTAKAVQELPVAVGFDGDLLIGDVLVAPDDVQEAGPAPMLSFLVALVGMLLVACRRLRA